MSDDATPRYPLEQAVLQLDLYRLAAIILASRAFREPSEVPFFHRDHLGSLAANFEETEVFRILLSSAVWLRVQLDQEHLDAPAAAGIVGTLRTCSSSDSTPEPLNLREACNKVIHAKAYRLGTADTDDFEQYLTGRVTFTGTHRGTPWEADLDILAFIRAAQAQAPS